MILSKPKFNPPLAAVAAKSVMYPVASQLCEVLGLCEQNLQREVGDKRAPAGLHKVRRTNIKLDQALLFLFCFFRRRNRKP